jgi:hypothetical protein
VRESREPLSGYVDRQTDYEGASDSRTRIQFPKGICTVVGQALSFQIRGVAYRP